VFKLLFQLAIVALLANATYHIGSEYVTYAKFQDSVRQAAMFKAKDEADLMARIVSLAEEYDVPIDVDNVTIERAGNKVSVSGWYDKPIEVLPSYQYPWHFGLSFEVASQRLPGMAPVGGPR
jgi:hypothetical protein